MAEAPDVLARQGLVLLEASVVDEVSKSVPLDDLASVFRALATYVEAGIALDLALSLAPGTATTRDLVDRVRDRLLNGASLGDAFAPERSIPPVVGALLGAGEAAGMSAALGDAAHQLDMEVELRGSIRDALIYPAVLVLTGAVALGVLLFVVLPRFVSLLTDVGAQLPVLTRVLVSVAQVGAAYGWWLGGAVSIAVGGVAIAWRTPGLQERPGRGIWSIGCGIVC